MSTNLNFHQVENEHLRACFLEAYAGFPELHQYQLSVELLALPAYTMRAQPVFNLHFFRPSTRMYRIQMSNHLQIAQYIALADLPREVLIGWFAHELGHIVDYHPRSAWSLLWFILGYFLFPTYRLGAERRADLFAIEHGFGPELLATKRYLSTHATLPEAYKLRLQKYYLSLGELEAMLGEKK